MKKGYNEKNPTQPEGAFQPASSKEPPGHDGTEGVKSNAADKKAKEDEENN